MSGFSSLRLDALPANGAGQGDRGLVPDEARVGQKGSIEYVSPPIGSRPSMLGDNRHDSVHIFGAIGPTRGVGATIIIPAVNTEAMNENLAEISTQVSQGAYCLSPATAPDGHQAGERLIIPDNITMLPLPPSAPKPNPMENAWGYCGAATS